MDAWISIMVGVLLGLSGDEWQRTLSQLDLSRAQAFAHADPERLDDVYVDATAAADDAELIRAYDARGGRVRGAMMWIETVRPLTVTDDHVVLEVADRLGPAIVTWIDGTSTDLPADSTSTRQVELVMTERGWRISATQTSTEH